MARAQAAKRATDNEETTKGPAADEDTEEGEGYSLEEVADFTTEQIATMDEILKGEKKLGRNMALMGFFQKSPEAQLVGVVRRMKEQTNRIDARNIDQILYIEGIALYPKDVIDQESGKVKVKAGRYSAMFAFQLDSGTGAFFGDDMLGARVHFHVKNMERLPSGFKRYAYHRAGLLAARAAQPW